jgi:hypothetical protein
LASKRYNLARVRSSGWHYLFVFISAAAAGAVWGTIFLPFYAVQKSLVPPDAFLSGGTVFGNLLFWLPPMYPALAICMILGRSIVRRIPAARAALEPELGDGTRTVSSLERYAEWGRVAMIAVLPLCFLGAMSTWAITPVRIEVRPIFWPTVHSYDWSRVREIETGCREGKSTSYNFVLELADGTHIDLMQNDPWGFEAAYPKIQSALVGRSYGFSNDGVVAAPCATYAPRSWKEMLTEPPTDQHSAPTL